VPWRALHSAHEVRRQRAEQRAKPRIVDEVAPIGRDDESGPGRGSSDELRQYREPTKASGSFEQLAINVEHRLVSRSTDPIEVEE
jgi:hypothetical protein